MPLGPVEFLIAVGPLRGLLLLGMVASSCRAVYLHLQDDHRDPVPWSYLVIMLVVTLAMVSLST